MLQRHFSNTICHTSDKFRSVLIITMSSLCTVLPTKTWTWHTTDTNYHRNPDNYTTPASHESILHCFGVRGSAAVSDTALQAGRSRVRVPMDFLIGTFHWHNPFISQYSPGARLSDSPLCRRCGAEDEITSHILCECEALASLRHAYLGSSFLEPTDIKSISLGAIWNFSKVTGLPQTDMGQKWPVN